MIFAHAWNHFKNFFYVKTGIEWDQRLEGIKMPDTYFVYTPPTGGRPIGLLPYGYILPEHRIKEISEEDDVVYDTDSEAEESSTEEGSTSRRKQARRTSARDMVTSEEENAYEARRASELTSEESSSVTEGSQETDDLDSLWGEGGDDDDVPAVSAVPETSPGVQIPDQSHYVAYLSE